MKRSEILRYDKTIYGLKYYLDELEAIAEIYTKWGYEIILEDDSYQYDDLNELVSENPQGLNNLEIKGNSDNVGEIIYIHIRKETTHIHGYTFTSKTRALALDIQEMLGKGRPRWFVVDLPFILIFIAGFLPAIALLLNSSNSVSPDTNFLPIAWIIWGIIMGVVFFLFVYRHYSKAVVTEHRRKNQSFVERNWEHILIAIISAVIGFIIATAGPKLFEIF